jgi:hypothetical protein
MGGVFGHIIRYFKSYGRENKKNVALYFSVVIYATYVLEDTSIRYVHELLHSPDSHASRIVFLLS